MYKEVNGSLIKWPAAASVTMLAISWFLMDPDSDQSERSVPAGDSPASDFVVVPELDAKLAPGFTNASVDAEPSVSVAVDQISDQQRDVTALKLPARVAAVLGEKVQDSESSDVDVAASNAEEFSTGSILRAPVRLIDQELAGLGLGEMNSGADESLTVDQWEEVAWGNLGWMPDVWSQDFWQPGNELARLAEQKPKSVLPDSNRALGRRDLAQNEGEEITPLSPWAIASAGLNVRMHATGEFFNDWLIVLARQSAKVKDFASRHKLEGRLRTGAYPGGRQAAETVAVVPVGGIISAEDEIAVPQLQQSVSRDVSAVRVATKDPVSAWPEAKQLVDQLEQLVQLSQDSGGQQGYRFVSLDGSELTIADWASRVQGLLADLRSLPRLGAEEAGSIIVALNSLATEGREQAELIEDRQSQLHWLRASYAISRRTAIWMPVWSLSQGHDVSWDLLGSENRKPIEASVQRVRDDLVATGDVNGWNTFLMLDEVLDQAHGGTASSRAILSQRLMSRLQWHSLGREQSQWLQRESIDELVAAIRPWAHTVVDYVSLVEQLERQEANAIDLAAVDIASAAQTLRFANSPAAVTVADGINTHYRNANVRFAITERFIERMIPAIEPTRVPVKTRMMGARVTGVSQINSKFDIDLKPANDRWVLKLKANGRVETDSVGKQGVVSVRTAASAKFDASSHIEVTKRGLYVGDADAKVRSSTRLRGVETAYDGWPLVGPLVRSIAEERYRDMAPQANRLANREARARIESEMDARIENRVDETAVALSEMVLGPLGRLQLDPCVTDMQTTEQRLLARYRVAGDWQLGAFTPRPRALSDSLMSVQLHQSALNNTLEQLIPAEQAIGIRDLISKSFGNFGKADVDIPEDIPADVTVQFARTRPITVEIEDGMLWLTLRILRLRRNSGIDLTQFIVRAGYRPEIDGMNARLVRDGHLRISGPRMAMRERLPVRAIFNKVFAASREIPLTVPRLVENPATNGLVVSQLELRDGWLAMAISEEGAARIALRQE